ncbi:MAG TPA: 1,4-alpha-glucan branching protein GlgB [Oligoflexia bacterium]|nr:1,4-alpha-glucan branching protein GlgB [Oligoflexia bacterium]HMP47570.1 1,4-alpha-glucan branching protein GlgB [Oligoflexia bacterium]
MSSLVNCSPFLGDLDLHLFSRGVHYSIYERLGAHPVSYDENDGFHFAVWAPNATRVSVIGDFNYWSWDSNPMLPQGTSGIWYVCVPEARENQKYKFLIHNDKSGFKAEKADPYARVAESAPRTASVLYRPAKYNWGDDSWMQSREGHNNISAPVSIYEVHLPSWKRVPEENCRSLNYIELAEVLPAYVSDLGFTHVEFLPPMEHPFEGSWGYQVTGYYAPNSRLGSPEDFKILIDAFHQAGIGVIIDWVPAHFPTDEFALSYFDGTHLYEHADPKMGFHPDWNTLIFNYGRNEVSNFLIANALFWLKEFHVDGLRVDAVASMLYLDYSRKEGEWIPNKYGGRENPEAIEFLRHLNTVLYERFPSAMMIAEESTAWPKVTGFTSHGGLGFGYKWNMGWMHDTLSFFQKDPIYRPHHHNQLTFSLLYAFSENFILSFSHDEVVHGKKSLLEKMPGDDWQKFANLRLLLSYMFMHSGKKLLFMGTELAGRREWDHGSSLDWHLRQYPAHEGIFHIVQDLNGLLRNYPALHQRDTRGDGFQWVDCSDHQQSIFSFVRKAENPDDNLLIVCNGTPVPRENYRVGCPLVIDKLKEIFNSNSSWYGGTNDGNMGVLLVDDTPFHGCSRSVSMFLPSLSVVVLGGAK